MLQHLITRKGGYDNGKFNIGRQFSHEVNQNPVTFKQLKFSQNIHTMKKDDKPPTMIKISATLILKMYNFYEKALHYELVPEKLLQL